MAQADVVDVLRSRRVDGRRESGQGGHRKGKVVKGEEKKKKKNGGWKKERERAREAPSRTGVGRRVEKEGWGKAVGRWYRCAGAAGGMASAVLGQVVVVVDNGRFSLWSEFAHGGVGRMTAVVLVKVIPQVGGGRGRAALRLGRSAVLLDAQHARPVQLAGVLVVRLLSIELPAGGA